jgi:superfamily I DNA/RNA helicase/RecB family exonuclease
MKASPNDVRRRVIDYPTANLRVLGPPRSGKSRLLVERYRHLEKRHSMTAPRRRGDGAGVFILTYSSESHRRLTRSVLASDAARLGAPAVVTYTRLAQEIVERARGRPLPVIADLEEHLLLQTVVDVCEPRFSSDLRSICRSERFRLAALDACHVLLQNGIEGRALERLMELAAPNPELFDVVTVYDAFRRALATKGVATYYDVAWRAAESCRDGPPDHPMCRAAAILVEDFQDVDAGQFELLLAVAPPGGGAAVNVFGDPMGSVFARRGTQHGYLMREFPKRFGGETLFLPARAAGVPAATLEALLAETVGDESASFLPVAFDDDDRAEDHGDGGARAAPATRDFRIEVTRDEMDEVYAVAAGVAGLLRTAAFRAEDIAIVTNDKQGYGALLAAAATQRGIPLETGRLEKRAFGDFVDALLVLIETPGDEVASRAILTSPLLVHLGEAAAPDPAAPPDGARKSENPLAFVEGLRGAIRSSDARVWMRTICERCLRPIAEKHSRESGDESFFREISRYLELWERYVAGLSAWGGRASVGAFAALDSLIAERRAPGASGAVSFLSCREAKGRFFPAVFVLGCSELLFPSAGGGDNVLPVSALEEALITLSGDRPVEVYRARSAPRRLAEEHHLLYVALTRSLRLLHVTSPRVFSGEELPAPCSVLERTVPKSAYGTPGQDSRTPPQIRFALAWTRREPSVGADADPRLERLSAAGSHWHAPVDREAPVHVAQFPLSKSSLETYLSCARRFFYEKVLRIPQQESAAAKVGLALHRVMAALGERFTRRSELLAGATEELIRKTIDDALRKDEHLGRAPFYELALRRRLEDMVRTIVDIERSEGEDRVIVGVEKRLRFSHGPWEFVGRIDRMDENSNGERVIVDYKTGRLDKTGRTLRKKTLYALEAPAKANWQVPLYAWGVRTQTGSVPRAFTHIVTPADERPFAVTLLIGRSEDDLPVETLKRDAYLIESEIESIMDRAGELAAEIFSPRGRFEKTNDKQACRWCDFQRLCGREDR